VCVCVCVVNVSQIITNRGRRGQQQATTEGMSSPYCSTYLCRYSSQNVCGSTLACTVIRHKRGSLSRTSTSMHIRRNSNLKAFLKGFLKCMDERKYKRTLYNSCTIRVHHKHKKLHYGTSCRALQSTRDAQAGAASLLLT